MVGWEALPTRHLTSPCSPIPTHPPPPICSMVSGLEEVLGVKLPADLDSEEARAALIKLVRAASSWSG